MPTFKTPHGHWRRYNATPGAHQRRQRAREAASIAGPAPAYPPMAPLHGDWLGGCINGHTVILRLMRDPSHRCDQWAAEVDGVTVADAAGLTRLWALLHPRCCRPCMTHQARHFRHGLPQSLHTAMPWPTCNRRTKHPISRQRRRASMSLRR